MLKIKALQRRVCCPDGSELQIADLPELVLERGACLALVGPSGSGKTTVLHMIAGLLTPSAGEIWFDGEPVTRLAPQQRDAWRAVHIGYVFQSFNLLPSLTVAENILAAVWLAKGTTQAADLARMRQLLQCVGLVRKADCYPDRLSMGEQQRAAVVRAVINAPELILADEPTANLDAANRDRVMELLQELAADGSSSLLVSTHDPAVMARFAQRYDLRQRRLLA